MVVGVEEPVFAANLPDVNDGSQHHAGPAAARRRPHGREDHTRHSHLQEDQVEDRRICSPQSHHHA